MKNFEDATSAIECGADFIGFVFAASKRQVTFDDAADIIRRTDTTCTKTVGVFVNPSADEVERALSEIPLDFVQLHGDETIGLTEQFAGRVIKAFPSNSELTTADKFDYPAKFVLIDSPRTQHYGGSGKTFDWDKLDMSNIDTARFALAGGLNRHNIHTAIDVLKPALVDTSSGVETDGMKDPVKIKAFIDNAKGGVK